VGTEVEIKEGKTNSRYECTAKGCTKNKTGKYRDLESCEQDCEKVKKSKKKKYACINGNCVSHINGSYNTLEDCKNLCATDTTTQTNTTVVIMYSCLDGVCFEDSDGLYSSIDTCIAACETREEEPREDGDEERDEERDEEDDPVDGGDSRDDGVCEDGYYWCEELRMCLHETDPCG